VINQPGSPETGGTAWVVRTVVGQLPAAGVQLREAASAIAWAAGEAAIGEPELAASRAWISRPVRASTTVRYWVVAPWKAKVTDIAWSASPVIVLAETISAGTESQAASEAASVVKAVRAVATSG